MKNKPESAKSKSNSFFFDEQKQSSSLWIKIKQQQDLLQYQIEGVLFKKNKSSNTFKEKTYILSDDKLFQFIDNSKNLKQFLDLTNMTLEKLKPIDNKQGFRLSKNQTFIDFYSDNEISSNAWFSFLKTYMIQRSFNQDYLMNRLIGQGNFAKVYSAQYKPTGQFYAIKAFEKEKFKDINLERQALVKELAIMRRMNHQGVLKLFEVHENETHIFLVCEQLEGGELFQKLKNCPGGYCENYVVQVMYKLLSALQYIHNQGIIHRDIKPENLILRSKFNDVDICIADFGLADYYNPQGNYMFKRCGTPGYVAPEVLQDKIYDYKVDLFSAGILMFIMLSGCSPFNALSYNEIVLKNYNCEINFNANFLLQKISKEANNLLQALLSYDPAQRPTAAQSLQFTWFKQFVNVINPLTNQNFILRLDGTYPQFLPQINAELFAKTPSINQNLSQCVSPIQSITPQSRSKSNTNQTDFEDKQEKRKQFQIKSQKIEEELDYQIEEQPEVQQVQKYQIRNVHQKPHQRFQESNE